MARCRLQPRCPTVPARQPPAAPPRPAAPAQLRSFSQYALSHSAAVGAIVLVSSANALAYNVFHYLMIQRTSGVATTVVGEVKIVGLMVLSALLLGERVGLVVLSALLLNERPSGRVRES